MKTQSNSFLKRITSRILLGLAIVGVLSFVSCKTAEPTVYYTVSYETEVGTAPEAFKVVSGTVLKEENLPELEAEGYYFAGWYVNGAKVIPGEYKVKSNITLTASWNFAVSYETEVGTAPETIKVIPGTVLSEEELPVLEAEGYTFTGWLLDGVKIMPDEYKVEGNVTLKAQWNCSVSYESDFGTAPESIDIVVGTVLAEENLPVIEAAGYNFTGWCVEGVKVNPGEYKVNAPVTLTASWTCTVSFVTDHGTAPEAVTVVPGSALKEADLPVLVAEGYSFSGWYLNGVRVIPGEYKVNGNVTLTALWTTATVTVTFEKPADISALKVEQSLENPDVWIFTAEEGYTSYTWEVDGTKRTDVRGKVLELDVSTFVNGTYIVSVVAYKSSDSVYRSATALLKISK